MKRNLFVLAIGILLSFYSNAQIDSIKCFNSWVFSAHTPDANYDSIVNEAESILSEHSYLSSISGSGYKDYVRWEFFWRNRAQYPEFRQGSYLSNYAEARRQWDSLCYVNGDTISENRFSNSLEWELIIMTLH